MRGACISSCIGAQVVNASDRLPEMADSSSAGLHTRMATAGTWRSRSLPILQHPLTCPSSRSAVPMQPPEEIVGRESIWKRKLGSRAHGLNEN